MKSNSRLFFHRQFRKEKENNKLFLDAKTNEYVLREKEKKQKHRMVSARSFFLFTAR